MGWVHDRSSFNPTAISASLLRPALRFCDAAPSPLLPYMQSGHDHRAGRCGAEHYSTCPRNLHQVRLRIPMGCYSVTANCVDEAAVQEKVNSTEWSGENRRAER